MKLSSLKQHNKKKIIRLFRVLFPLLGTTALWSLFYKEKKKTKFLQIEKKKRFLGFVAISTLAFLGRKALYLRFFAVDPKKQGKGIGSRVLKKLEQMAKEKGHHFLFLVSRYKRKKAHKFYFKNGFKRFLGFLFWKKLK